MSEAMSAFAIKEGAILAQLMYAFVANAEAWGAGHPRAAETLAGALGVGWHAS